MSTLISADELGPEHLLLDARMTRGAYTAAHLEGAHGLDVETELTGDASDPSRGGRHPLPTLDAWCRTLGHIGVGPDTRVVFYDDANGAKAAARAWWMLRAVGHEHAWVLEGGFDAAIAAGVPSTQSVPTRAPMVPYPATQWTRGTASIEEVESGLADGSVRLIDVRNAERFAGAADPYDPRPGHIPNAENVPYSSNLAPSGRFLERGALRALYAEALGDTPIENVIISCGSGITACHTLLALEHAGLRGARLFVGSYSEWSRSQRAIASD